MGSSGPATALVLSGGVALGAYEAGACEALEEWGSPGWVLGASAGALNAAIFAGNPPNRRVQALRRFWEGASTDPMPWASFWLGSPPETGAWREAYNALAAWQSILLGRPGVFRPAPGDAPSLHDLEPLRRRLPECLDFDRLQHASAPRLTVVTTDLLSGERVVLDTRRGTRIGPEHLMASSALLPLFAPVEVDGRLLGDGGLSSNAPLDLVLGEPSAGVALCVVVELFARQGSQPRSIAASAARAGDLAFGNQTRRLLEAGAREYRLRDLVRRAVVHVPRETRDDPELVPVLKEAEAHDLTILLLGYRAGLAEAGLGKPFDFSRATVADRWRAGAATMRDGLSRLDRPDAATLLAPGLRLHEVEG